MNPVNSELQGSIEGMLIRGGTSKGLYVTSDQLPSNEFRDDLILELFGSPDPLQIDGIGGTHSHTSKIIIVEKSKRSGVDIDYTFGQVGISQPTIDWSGNCGNLTSGVGVFAILDGLIEPTEPIVTLTLSNTNTNTKVEQEIPVNHGEPDVYGDYSIDGVPGTGAKIESCFRNPEGAVTGALFPTGNPIDVLNVDGTEIELSIVDATNLNVFLRATDVGLTGTELPAELNEQPKLVERLERIRGTVCVELGLVDNVSDAAEDRSAIPQIAIVSEPQSYSATTDQQVFADELDLVARIITSQTPHHSYAMTGAMCLATASHLEGTIPNEVVRDTSTPDITIGHPKGTIQVGAEVSNAGSKPSVKNIRVGRTARLIMNGNIFYRYIDDIN